MCCWADTSQKHKPNTHVLWAAVLCPPCPKITPGNPSQAGCATGILVTFPWHPLSQRLLRSEEGANYNPEQPFWRFSLLWSVSFPESRVHGSTQHWLYAPVWDGVCCKTLADDTWGTGCCCQMQSTSLKLASARLWSPGETALLPLNCHLNSLF